MTTWSGHAEQSLATLFQPLCSYAHLHCWLWNSVRTACNFVYKFSTLCKSAWHSLRDILNGHSTRAVFPRTITPQTYWDLELWNGRQFQTWTCSSVTYTGGMPYVVLGAHVLVQWRGKSSGHAEAYVCATEVTGSIVV